MHSPKERKSHSSLAFTTWLDTMGVSNQTKLTRLKCLKAFLERCTENGWLTERFWRSIRIQVDTPVKEGATDKDVKLLLSVLDLSDFVQLRDAVAILTLRQTGIRLDTVSQLRNKHADLDAKLLRIDGGFIKNHESLLLPFDEVLAQLFTVLLVQNDVVRKSNVVRNDFEFITQTGGQVVKHKTNHTLAKRLFDQGAHITVVSSPRDFLSPG